MEQQSTNNQVLYPSMFTQQLSQQAQYNTASQPVQNQHQPESHLMQQQVHSQQVLEMAEEF